MPDALPRSSQSHLILLQLCEVSTGIVPILQMG